MWPARVRDKTGTSPLFFRSPCPTRPSLLRICGARPLSTERLEYGGEEEGGSARAPPAGRPPVRCDAGQLVPPRPPRTPFRPRTPLPVDHMTRARSHSGGERTSFAGHGHGIGRTFFATRSGRRRRRRALGPRPRVGDGGARLGVALHEWRRRRRGARKRCFLLAGEGGGPRKESVCGLGSRSRPRPTPDIGLSKILPPGGPAGRGSTRSSMQCAPWRLNSALGGHSGGEQ